MGKGLRWALLGIVSGLAIGLFSLSSFDANALRVKELQLNVPDTAVSIAATESTLAKIEIPEPILNEPTPQNPEQAIAAEEEQSGTWHEITVQADFLETRRSSAPAA